MRQMGLGFGMTQGGRARGSQLLIHELHQTLAPLPERILQLLPVGSGAQRKTLVSYHHSSSKEGAHLGTTGTLVQRRAFRGPLLRSLQGSEPRGKLASGRISWAWNSARKPCDEDDDDEKSCKDHQPTPPSINQMFATAEDKTQ